VLKRPRPNSVDDAYDRRSTWVAHSWHSRDGIGSDHGGNGAREIQSPELEAELGGATI